MGKNGAKMEKQKTKTFVCKNCQGAFESLQENRKFCSVSCHMKKLNLDNKEIVRERMKNNNPMLNPENIEKGLVTRRLRGTLDAWGEKNRGGNGRPLPIPQQILAVALGWPTEVPIALGRITNYPTCYKIDIANRKLKLGIEVDGVGHLGKGKFLDQKKTEKLEELGWKILRFSNKEIMKDLDLVLKSIQSEMKNL